MPRLSAPIMDEMAVNGDVGTLHVNNNEGPPVLNDVITSNGVEISSNGANTAGALRNTVHMISMDNNTKVYIVGTAHFSEESNEEVRQVSIRLNSVVCSCSKTSAPTLHHRIEMSELNNTFFDDFPLTVKLLCTQ